MSITLNGQPWRMPLVASKKLAKHPIILKHLVRVRYMPERALCVPKSIPCVSATPCTLT